MEDLQNLTNDMITRMSREDAHPYIKEYILGREFDFSDNGLAFEIRRILYDRGFGSRDRIHDSRFGVSDGEKDQFYQIWFERWNVEGEGYSKFTWGTSCSKGLQDEEMLNFKVSKAALWTLAGYEALVRDFEELQELPTQEMIMKFDNYMGILRKKKE